MVGTFDLREDIDELEVGEVEWATEWEAVGEGVMEDEGGVDVGVATTNSGL